MMRLSESLTQIRATFQKGIYCVTLAVSLCIIHTRMYHRVSDEDCPLMFF